jgi:hypothetical protein
MRQAVQFLGASHDRIADDILSGTGITSVDGPEFMLPTSGRLRHVFAKMRSIDTPLLYFLGTRYSLWVCWSSAIAIFDGDLPTLSTG